MICSSLLPQTTDSSQGLLAEFVALLYLLNRIPALVRVLDIGWNLPARFLQHLQHVSNWRVALPKLHVRPLPLLAVLDMKRDRPLVVFVQERDRVVSRSDEVADVQVHSDPPG